MQITVIIVTYNQEALIARAIDSVLSQKTEYSFELLIGEDGGTDGTRAICEDYCRRYPDKVRLMPKAPNKGLVKNYFDCVRAAKGEFIAELGGDDYWIDDSKLQKETEILLENPDVSVVHTSWKVSTNGDVIKPLAADLSEKKDIIRAIALQKDVPVMHSCTWMYRREIITNAIEEEPDFFLNYCCEDIPTAYALAKAGRAHYLDVPTLYYQVSEGTISNSNIAIKQYEFVLSATRLFYEIIKRENLKGEDVDAYLQHRIYVLLMHLINADRSDKLEELLGFTREWQLGLNFRNRITLFALKNRFFRSIFLSLHKVLKAVFSKKGGMS